MTEELCFHSFPRLRHGETIETAISKGTKIALSILNNGLLLAPENFEIPIRDLTGAKVDSLTVLQCRICFTLLSLRELRTHSQTFGPFSLAFEIDSLRQIGALPIRLLLSHGKPKTVSVQSYRTGFFLGAGLRYGTVDGTGVRWQTCYGRAFRLLVRNLASSALSRRSSVR